VCIRRFGGSGIFELLRVFTGILVIRFGTGRLPYAADCWSRSNRSELLRGGTIDHPSFGIAPTPSPIRTKTQPRNSYSHLN
jgi:hypothetical protein